MDGFQRISIIGLGLMGGSFALALKNRKIPCKIVGYDTSSEYLMAAKASGAIDVAAAHMKEAVADAQLVVIAVPIGYYPEVFQGIADHLSPHCIVTDVGSVKSYVVEMAKQFLPDTIQFIGGHPMTGSEKGGFHAADPYLYENAYYFLTKESSTNMEALNQIELMIKTLGAFPVVSPPEEHDQIVSLISHLPHLIASVLVNMMDQNKGISYLPFVGGGFRDTTRIASGNPAMWKDIFFYNKDQVLKSISSFEVLLKTFRDSLESNHSDLIFKDLENAKLIRDSIPHQGRDYISPLFEIIVSVEDRPGVLAELTHVIGSNAINIKEIEILHARQEEKGAVRLAFASLSDRDAALAILKQGKFPHSYAKDEKSVEKS
ncbi:MAG: prephenate dehydrogenase/arogenate dehydrogenase family protein [Bacillota bacterium]